MFIEVTQDLGMDIPKRKVMWNMDTVVKFYANKRGGCTFDMKDGKKLCVSDTYDSLVRKIEKIQSTAK